MREQYTVMVDDYIKFLEKYPQHPVTYDLMQALVDYQTRTLYSFKPKQEVTEEQLRQIFIEKYNDPKTTDIKTLFVKKNFPTHRDKLAKPQYEKFLLEHLTEGYKGSKITKKDMNAIVGDYQATIQKFLAAKHGSEKSSFLLPDAIDDVVFSKLIDFLYHSQKEPFTKEYFLKHYEAATTDDKDVMLIKKHFPSKKSLISRKSYFELILDYLTIG